MFGGENGDRKIRLAGSGEKVQACNKTLEESTQLRNIVREILFQNLISYSKKENMCKKLYYSLVLGSPGGAT